MTGSRTVNYYEHVYDLVIRSLVISVILQDRSTTMTTCPVFRKHSRLGTSKHDRDKADKIRCMTLYYERPREALLSWSKPLQDTYGYLLVSLKKCCFIITDVFLSVLCLMATGATRLIQLAIVRNPTRPIALSVTALPSLHHSASDPLPAALEAVTWGISNFLVPPGWH